MSKINLRQAWAELMLELGRNDDRIVTVVGDISHGILQPYARAFPQRYYNIGICEPTIVGLAAGLAHLGFVPFVHTIAPFLIERPYEQIKLDFGYQRLPVNLVSVGGSFDYSQLGCSHHTYADVAMIASIEGSSVYVPGSAEELKILMTKTYRDEGIKYFRLTENPHHVDLSAHSVSPGKGLVVQPGSDVTVIALGPQLSTAVEVANRLRPKISVEVLYLHTFQPFDEELVRRSIGKTGAFVSIEELGPQGGLFHATLAAVAGSGFRACKQLAVRGFVSGYGTYEDLKAVAKLSSADLEKAVVEVCNLSAAS